MPYIQAKQSRKNLSAVIYIADDGHNVIRLGGSRAWRNNNPGNMRLTAFSRRHGAIGKAGGFAVFPDVNTGLGALENLLRGESYRHLSISAAIEKYAPPHKNETEQYRLLIKELTGLDLQLTIKALNNDQLEKVLKAIQHIEGYQKGTERPIKKIVGTKIESQRLVAFLIEGETTYISKKVALQMANREEIDALVVRSARGELYLRASADGKAENNFKALAIVIG